MAVWKDARVTWKGQDISSSVRAISLELGADAPEQTAMGDNWREFAAGGLKTAAVEMELNWGAGSTTGVDSLFGSTSNLAQSGAFTIRPTTGSIAAGNPQYSGNFIVTGYTPGSGEVGVNHQASVSLQLNGALTRAITT
jgi:hypothetical protein